VLVSEENVRELRRLVLTRAGFDVEAPELGAAPGMMESAPFDALVLSVHQSDGCQLIATFRRCNPNARVLAGERDGGPV
jgi:DNA-binding response OmpR family regulator